ncbi:MAG: AAA family ATPase [Oscillospiraceae bacterium]|nr:AAA family ATPase [Oscillospiraceae bacterium]
MSVKISITGDLGSGKSTVCKELNNKYGLKIFSTGTIQRKIAVDMGMTTLELNKYMETHPEIDEQIDGELVKLSSSDENIAIDSRMAWHFVKNTYKVFLTTDETVAAQRVVSDQRGQSERYADVPHAIKLLKERKTSENYRYKDKYGVDCYNYANFDLILDTTEISPAAMADTIMRQCSEAAANDVVPLFLISPLCLYPTKRLDHAALQHVDEYCDLLSQGKPTQPVRIVASNGYFYIYDGHCRAAAHKKLGMPLVPCMMVAGDEGLVAGDISADEFALREYSLSKAKDWEGLIGLEFITYPQ